MTEKYIKPIKQKLGTRCVAEVHDGYTHKRPCKRRASFIESKMHYCGTHCPSMRAARRETEKAKRLMWTNFLKNYKDL